MKKIRKVLSLVLCLSMVLNFTLPNLATGKDSLESSGEDMTISSSYFDYGENDTTKRVVEEENTSQEDENSENPNGDKENNIEKEESDDITTSSSDSSESNYDEKEKGDMTMQSSEDTTYITTTALSDDATTYSSINNAESTNDEYKTESTSASEAESTIDQSTNTKNSEDENTSTPSDATTFEYKYEIATISEAKKVILGEGESYSKLRLYTENGPTYCGIGDLDMPEPPMVEEETKLTGRRLFGEQLLPAKYDSREQHNKDTGLSYIPPVRDQLRYGTCWAHSVIACIETALRIKGLVSNEKESNMSELALAYFHNNLYTVNDKKYLGMPGLQGFDSSGEKGKIDIEGGNPRQAFLGLSSYMGVVEEDENTAYTNESITRAIKEGLDPNYAFNRNSFVINGVQFLNMKNVDLIKKAIMENGTVNFIYDANDGAFSTHADDEGVYYCSQGKGEQHGANLVGWDDNMPKEKFFNGNDYQTATAKAKSNGAWLFRNSWGSWYGKDGYYWIAYDDISLYKTCCVVTDVIKADTYKYNYHYDTTAHTYNLYYTMKNNEKYWANLFKVSGEDRYQSLEAVNLCINSANSKFRILIYASGEEMDNPTDGKLVASKECSNTAAGIYTYQLDKPVFLERDGYYSIIVEPITKNMEISYDGLGNLDNPRNHINMVRMKQSYIGLNNGIWADMNLPKNLRKSDFVGMNWRIKGLCNEARDPELRYTISFDNNGGEGTMDQQIVVPEVATKINDNLFTKKGYKFLYFEDENGNKYTNKYPKEIVLTKDITLKAIWEPIKYQIEFKYTELDSMIKNVIIDHTYDEAIKTETPNNVIEGFEFGGWYVDDKKTKKYNGEELTYIEVSKPIPLYAKWNKYKLDVNFSVNIDGVIIDKQSAYYGDYIKLPKVEAFGYTFDKKWYKDENYNELVGLESEDYEVKNKTTLYCKLTPITYNISVYNTITNKVDKVIKKTYGVNTSYSVPITPMKLEGYLCCGLYLDNGTFEKLFDINDDIYNGSIDDNIVFTRWIPVSSNEDIVYKVTFKNDKGPKIAPQYLKINNKITEPSIDYSISGWTFVGWQDMINKKSDDDFWDFDKDEVGLRDVALEAVWKENPDNDASVSAENLWHLNKDCAGYINIDKANQKYLFKFTADKEGSYSIVTYNNGKNDPFIEAYLTDENGYLDESSRIYDNDSLFMKNAMITTHLNKKQDIYIFCSINKNKTGSFEMSIIDDKGKKPLIGDNYDKILLTCGKYYLYNNMNNTSYIALNGKTNEVLELDLNDKSIRINQAKYLINISGRVKISNGELVNTGKGNKLISLGASGKLQLADGHYYGEFDDFYRELYEIGALKNEDFKKNIEIISGYYTSDSISKYIASNREVISAPYEYNNLIYDKKIRKIMIYND